MVVHTKLEICNQDKKIKCSYSTKWLTGARKKEDIETFILKKYKNSKPPFDMEILDQHHGYVTLDDDYLEEYNPFEVEKKDTTTVQPINSSEPSVTLRVTLPDSILFPPTDQQHIVALEEMLEVAAKEIQTIDRALSIPEFPKHPTICLSKDPRMGFIVGHNVNDKQRDQYVSDEVNVSTGKNTTGTLSMIQGQKGPKNKSHRVLPRFSIRHDVIEDTIDHDWTLLIFIVLDVYESGKRTLFYHPQRTFVQKDNVIQQMNLMNPYEIPITTMNWMKNMGEELKLTTVVIEKSKIRFNVPMNIICNLEDINQNELSCSSSKYSKSRLALVLGKDNNIQWETLVLSDEMNFQKTPNSAVRNKNCDVLKNTVVTSLKRKRSETTANKRTKQPKMTSLQGHSSMVNLSTNTNDSSVLHDQSSSIHDGNNQIINIIPQTMSNFPEFDPDRVLVPDKSFNSTDTGDSSGDPMKIINILQDEDWPILSNMDDGALINSDHSLYTPLFSPDDPSNSWKK